ncbi:MAG: bis(5'-nucleosyl)-tetraphosphatase [Bacilli bacterium]
MTFEKSCGAIIIRKNDEITETLLIQMIGGHWSFPKGHVENNETEVETALREIKEETNLDVTLDTRFREITTYSPKPNVLKDVIFFIGYAKNCEVTIQESEVKNYAWVNINDACETITYDEDKKIIRKAIKYLGL